VFHVDNATGNFSTLYNLTGTMNDFSFVGLGTPNYPAIPFVGFEVMASSAFSFDLLTATVTNQTNSDLTLTGTGMFHLDGYDATMGIYSFQANQSGGTFSFAGSESVPEPGSMLLLGTGLFGLAGAVRRRMKK
jgi:hypothetical protein